MICETRRIASRSCTEVCICKACSTASCRCAGFCSSNVARSKRCHEMKNTIYSNRYIDSHLLAGSQPQYSTASLHTAIPPSLPKIPNVVIIYLHTHSAHSIPAGLQGMCSISPPGTSTDKAEDSKGTRKDSCHTVASPTKASLSIPHLRSSSSL
jgi:hypothetical protein